MRLPFQNSAGGLHVSAVSTYLDMEIRIGLSQGTTNSINNLI